MGVNAAVLACAFVRAVSERQGSPACVIDPFCGEGTALCVANELGMDACGVELSRRRCRVSLGLRLLNEGDRGAAARAAAAKKGAGGKTDGGATPEGEPAS